MKKKIYIVASLGLSLFTFAQVGVNTDAPKATLDVVSHPTGQVLDGVIAPRTTGVVLRGKTYTNDQNGAIVYVTAADTAPAGQTIDVTSVGYYYFDARTSVNKWVKLVAGALPAGDTTQDVWKDVPAETGTLIAGPQSAIGPARSETNTTTTDGSLTNYQKAVYTDTNRFGIGTVNPSGAFHVYSGEPAYIDRVGNGNILFLRKSGNNGTAASPTTPLVGAGLGSFVLSAYTGEATAGTGGWNQSGGASLQSMAAENLGATNGGTALRILTTPKGSLTRLPAISIEHTGKTVISGSIPTATGSFTQYTQGDALGRLTIQDSSSDALYINAPLADQSALTTGRLLVWDSVGSTVGTNQLTGGTYNNGKVGTAPLSGLVKANTTAVASGNITEYVGEGSTYIGTSVAATRGTTGVILTSPDGSLFKITVNNDGSLNSQKVTIP